MAGIDVALDNIWGMSDTLPEALLFCSEPQLALSAWPRSASCNRVVAEDLTFYSVLTLH